MANDFQKSIDTFRLSQSEMLNIFFLMGQIYNESNFATPHATF